MKSALLGTTASIGAGLARAGPAAAHAEPPIQLTVGGFLRAVCMVVLDDVHFAGRRVVSA